MKKSKRIMAMIGVIILVGLYFMTLIFSLMENELAQGLFMASLAATFVVPVIIYACMYFYKISNKPQDDQDFKNN